MSNANETITDIIKETRAEADYIEETARGSLKAGEDCNGTAFAESDLESALCLAETKRKEADRLEAAWKREKASVEADALAVGGLVEASRATAEKPSAVGDAAKLREALKLCVDEMCDRCRELAAARGNPLPCLSGCEPVRKAKFALSKPVRNCDVGTAEEQEGRFEKFCDAHKYVGDDGANVCSRDCPCYNRVDCGIGWAQMLYEKGGAK